MVPQKGQISIARRWKDDRGAARIAAAKTSYPRLPGVNVEEPIAAWMDRFTELYYDSEPMVTDDGALYWDNAYGRFTLRLDEDETGRMIRIQIDWPEP